MGRHPPHPPPRDHTPAAAPALSSLAPPAPCVPPALQELHHQGPGEEPTSLGPPLLYPVAAWRSPVVGFR